LFFPTPLLFYAHIGGTPCDINVIYTPLERTFNAYNSIADNISLSSFVLLLLAPKCTKFRKMPREFELIACKGYPRSSTLVPMESAYYATSYIADY